MDANVNTVSGPAKLEASSTPGSPPAVVSPVNWLRTFAYTPQTCHDHVRVDSHRRDRVENGRQLPENDDEDDRLPTAPQTQSWNRIRASASAPAPVRASSVVSARPGPSTVPSKRKRRSTVDHQQVTNASATRHPSPPLPDVHEPPSATPVPPKHKRTMIVQLRRSCDVGHDGHVSHDLDGGAVHEHTTSSSRPNRVLLDAVEIVRKKRGSPSGKCVERETIHTTSESSQHPFRESRTMAPSDSISQRSLANSGESNFHASKTTKRVDVDGEPPLPVKTSKYFTRASTSQTHPSGETTALLTPPSSPVLTIPVYIESSDFEPPPFEDACHGPRTEELDGTPGLFDDFMIMLKRLKPILIQESVRDDPWKVLIAVRLLNVTSGKAAIPVFSRIIHRWPTPQDLVNAPHDELVELLRPLGLYNKRASWLKQISTLFVQDVHSPHSPPSPHSSTPTPTPKPTPRSSTKSQFGDDFIPTNPVFYYPGLGPYAYDSLRIFGSSAGLVPDDEWMRVMPADKELIRYLRWRWAVQERKIWYPEGIGVIGDVDLPYLVTLVDELAGYFDTTVDPSGEVYMYHFHNDLLSALEGPGSSRAL